MKRIITEIRRFELRAAAKTVLLVVSPLSIFDAFVAVLGGTYLSENIGAFLGKSRAVILSDLLFLEGAVILAIGIFVAVARAWQGMSTETTDAELTGDRRIHPSVLMMISGAILIGLSITVGTLLL